MNNRLVVKTCIINPLVFLMKTYAIILAGGQGTRIKSDIPKQFLTIAGKPVIAHTIKKFTDAGINDIIVAAPSDYIEHTKDIINRNFEGIAAKVISGGETRQLSAYSALTCKTFSDDDILLFHDAARPFINSNTITQCIEKAKKHGACGVYVKATDTIAEADNDFVKSIPSREKLYYTQTPQAFQYKVIRHAHEIAQSKSEFDYTDDVKLVLNAGYKVKIIQGDYSNIKITTDFDLRFAGFLLNGN